PETPKIEDPRVGHEFILDVDEFGNVTRQAAVAYARAHAELSAQGRAYVTLTETRFVNQAEEAEFYRVGTEIEQKLFEVGALDLPKAGEGLLALETLRSTLDALDPANDLPFEGEVSESTVQRRLLK